MRMRAGGGATPSSSRAEVEVDCEGADGGCSGKEQQLREELADMLGVPLSRLRVSSV
jgi:tellurite resistance protein